MADNEELGEYATLVALNVLEEALDFITANASTLDIIIIFNKKQKSGLLAARQYLEDREGENYLHTVSENVTLAKHDMLQALVTSYLIQERPDNVLVKSDLKNYCIKSLPDVIRYSDN